MRRKAESSNGEGSKGIKQASKQELKEERENLVLWKRPIKTLDYFVRELSITLYSLCLRILQYRKSLLFLVSLSLVFAVLVQVKGPHQEVLELGRKILIWCLYWLGLGVLSSIGLGTGLHTFILYLGPHIAAVTIAAYECHALNFPEPPYPDDIICPEEVNSAWATSIWNIMWKVHLEAIMWGAGTALGELPPYFMARAARLSGYDPEDEDDLKEFEELQRKKENHEAINAIDRAKLMVERLVNKVGFFGILVCASIPNPLFDLAGITCGHFLVPFWTFFGATLIGKAFIKMSIQVVFVIIAFSDVLIDKVTFFLGTIPSIGHTLQGSLQKILQLQRERFHRDSHSKLEANKNPLAVVFEVFVMSMIAYFVVSIINSLAQSHHKRLHKSESSKKHWND